MNSPWNNTTQNIASKMNSRYETPMGAQQKIEQAFANYNPVIDTNDFKQRLSEIKDEINAQLDDKVSQKSTVVTDLALFKKRDGEVDDTLRLQRLIDYCKTMNVPLHLNGGVYTLVSVNIPAGVQIYGGGATFIKPKLNAAPYNYTVEQMKWVRMFNVTYSGDLDSGMTVIENLYFDGNCWSMWSESSYDQEHASMLFVYGDSAKPGRLKIKINNCHFKNNVSDGIHIFTNCDATINNCSSYDCFRGGVTITGGYSKVTVTNHVSVSNRLPDGVDSEVDSPGYGGTYSIALTINNAIVDTDFDVQIPENSTCNINNLIMSKEKGTCTLGVTYGATLNMTNCQIVSAHGDPEFDRLLLQGRATFTNCQFFLRPYDGNPEDPCLYIFALSGFDAATIALQEFDKTHIARFTGCSFSYLGADYASQQKIGVLISANEAAQVKFIDCTFDKTLNTAVQAQIKQLELKDCSLNTRSYGARTTSNDYNPNNVIIIDNLDIKNNTTSYLDVTGINSTIIHRNMTLTEQNNKPGGLIFMSSLENAAYHQLFRGSRTIYVDHDPNVVPYVKGILGDIAIHTVLQEAGNTAQWVCTRMLEIGNETKSTWTPLAPSFKTET